MSLKLHYERIQSSVQTMFSKHWIKQTLSQNDPSEQEKKKKLKIPGIGKHVEQLGLTDRWLEYKLAQPFRKPLDASSKA
jgi:hypothetical protein